MTKEENPSLLFFPVPEETEERSKWLRQIGMYEQSLLKVEEKVLAVCELHFEVWFLF